MHAALVHHKQRSTTRQGTHSVLRSDNWPSESGIKPVRLFPLKSLQVHDVRELHAEALRAKLPTASLREIQYKPHPTMSIHVEEVSRTYSTIDPAQESH